MQLDALDELLESARNSNGLNGITGVLVYVEGVFLQILEGDKTCLLNLMDKISKDVRHETVTILRETDVPSAFFGDWKMAYVSASAEQVAAWAGLSRTADMPEILSDLHKDQHRATQIAQSILSLLAR